MTGDHDLLIQNAQRRKIDGWQIFKSLRAASHQAPVRFLTERNDLQDRIKRFEAWPDDYLVQRFVFLDLLARVHTLLRRGAKTLMTDRLEAAGLVIDSPRCRASQAGRRLTLTSKGISPLELLMRRCGEVLPRSLITSQV